MKKILVLGGGGFIGGHLAKKLKNEGCWVRICDVKKHEYFEEKDICHEFIQGDLKDINVVRKVLLSPNQEVQKRFIDYENNIEEVVGDSFDEVYQLAADMGGAAYIFTGENDANVMHNSVLINLNVTNESVKYGERREHMIWSPLRNTRRLRAAYPYQTSSWERSNSSYILS